MITITHMLIAVLSTILNRQKPGQLTDVSPDTKTETKLGKTLPLSDTSDW